MYRKLIFLFCFLMILSELSFADFLPDVLAVCKIELRDGKTIEGVIIIGQGAMNRYYDTNGFYLVLNEKMEKILLFNPDFYAIQPYKGIVELSPTSRGGGWGPAAKKKGWFENPKIYFLHDITSQKLQGRDFTEATATADTLDSGIMLKRDIVHHDYYELLDYIPVFEEVPRDLYLGQKISIQPLKVSTKDIERFELVLEPSPKWLDQITSAAGEWTKKHQAEENFEVPPPDWFHQIRKEREKYKDFFKPWNF